MTISSRDNPNVKLLCKLLSGKKQRAENGLFVIEGMRGCIDAVKEYRNGKIKLTGLFCCRETVENYRDNFPVELLDELDKSLVFSITKELADRISEEKNTQGIFAVAEMLHKKLAPQELAGGKYLVLDGIRDPGNLGTLLRTADAFGVTGAVLTGNCCDLYNPKTVRSTVGSLARIPVYIENDFYTVVKILEEADIKTFAAVVRDGTSVTEVNFPENCAVVLGNEGSGLSEEHIDACNRKITVKMKGNAESLNAAAAGAVLLWEMTRD